MCWVGFFLTVFPSITTRRLSPFRKLSTSSWSLFLFAWSWKSPLTLSPWLWPCWSGTHQCKDAHTWCIQGAQVYNKTMPRLERATLIDFALWLCTLVFIVRLLCQLQIAGLLNQFEELKIWVQIVPSSFPSFTSRSGMWSRMFHISTMCSMIVDFEVLARTLGGLVLESMGVDHLLICRKTMDSFAWLASPCRYTCFSTTGSVIMHIKEDNDNWTLSSDDFLATLTWLKRGVSEGWPLCPATSSLASLRPPSLSPLKASYQRTDATKAQSPGGAMVAVAIEATLPTLSASPNCWGF